MSFFFFFNDTATTEIYTLSLHDALPIYPTDDTVLTVALADSILSGADYADKLREYFHLYPHAGYGGTFMRWARSGRRDRKSTRLNSSHLVISYAVFCLKNKKTLSRQDIR